MDEEKWFIEFAKSYEEYLWEERWEEREKEREAYGRAWKILRDYIYDDNDAGWYWFKGLPAEKLLEIAEILKDFVGSWRYEAEKSFLHAIEIAKKYPDAIFGGIYKEDCDEIEIGSVAIRFGDDVFIFQRV